MALETIYKVSNEKGEYSCGELGISLEDWYDLISQPKAEQYIDSLLCFLREPDHKATCTTVAKKYGESASHYVGKINGFAKWVQKTLNRFNVVGTDGNDSFWPIPMKKGFDGRNGFEWQLRDELADALQRYLMKKLISCYSSCEPFNGHDEEYKWELLEKTEGQLPLVIVQAIRGINIVDNERVDLVFKSLSESKPKELSTCVENLFDDTKPLVDRLAKYKSSMRTICPTNWNNCANDERTAAALLTCHKPEVYTIYKDEIYQLLCQYFGFTSQSAGKKYVHFCEIINNFTKQYGSEIQSLMVDQIKDFKIKPKNLAVQTMIWCLKEEMKKELQKNRRTSYWMAGITLDYEDRREEFFSEGKWMGVGSASLNKDIESIGVGDILMLKSTYTKGTDHKTSAIKIYAVGIVTSTATKGEKFYTLEVEWISTLEKEFTDFQGAYRQTIHKVTDELFINYAKEQLNMTTPSRYQYYIDLLKETKNLVLTGAPGTGKTFMAQAIAKEMGAEVKFVQFHPSYDYTDFVEGLRPVDNGNGQMGFERKDGVFKEFCKRAMQNVIDSEKSVESLTNELSWQDRLSQFIEEAIEHETKFTTVSGNDFSISELRNHSIIVYNERNAKTSLITVSYDDILRLLAEDAPIKNVQDIHVYFNRKVISQPDSYTFALTNAIRKIKTKQSTVKVDKVEKKPFVMIIDEVNRGEASKIFGELFYAIDSGYRGKTDVLVQTQYQNLVPDTDVFAKGFYVPDNVYILATMNDIDRSVESMDFAMRRRFTWKEVKPSDTQDMLDSLGSIAIEAKTRMARLNEVIADTDGLGDAYMVGPSYFLKLASNGGDFEKLWVMNIEPLLKEYLRGFRKANETIEKFEDAYFAKEETIDNHFDLVDEN